jgi:hypothetical protein
MVTSLFWEKNCWLVVDTNTLSRHRHRSRAFGRPRASASRAVSLTTNNNPVLIPDCPLSWSASWSFQLLSLVFLSACSLPSRRSRAPGQPQSNPTQKDRWLAALPAPRHPWPHARFGDDGDDRHQQPGPGAPIASGNAPLRTARSWREHTVASWEQRANDFDFVRCVRACREWDGDEKTVRVRDSHTEKKATVFFLWVECGRVGLVRSGIFARAIPDNCTSLSRQKEKKRVSWAVPCVHACGQDPRPRHRTCRAHARRTETRDDDLRLASGRPDLRLAGECTESALWEKSSVEGETVISAVKWIRTERCICFTAISATAISATAPASIECATCGIHIAGTLPGPPRQCHI